MTGTILIVDDEEDTAILLRDSLRKRGFDVDAVTSGQAALEHLRTTPADVVVTDVQMAGLTGIELCTELRERHPDLLPIVLTGQGGLDTAIAAIRAGAYDFITKPVKVDALAIAVARAIEHLALRREVKRLRSAAPSATCRIDGIAGIERRDPRDHRAWSRRVADSDATVLVTGESGTGKELVARALHHLSPRRDQPFVAINCAAMPAPLLESELFGHVRGAFTDAKHSRAGLFVQAARGHVFLDEIGEMPIEMQVKLLRVLQERKVRPVGGDEEVPFEARVIAATNRDLETEVEDKRFREDLFYRINVVAIPVPPLRARAGDILLLAQYFLKRIAGRTQQAGAGHLGARPRACSWTTTGRATCASSRTAWSARSRCAGSTRSRSMICRRRCRSTTSSKIVITTESPGELITLDEMERRYVRQVLGAVGGNKTHAARILGIDRRSLYRRLEEPRDRKEEPKPADPHHVQSRPPTVPTHVQPPGPPPGAGEME